MPLSIVKIFPEWLLFDNDCHLTNTKSGRRAPFLTRIASQRRLKTRATFSFVVALKTKLYIENACGQESAAAGWASRLNQPVSQQNLDKIVYRKCMWAGVSVLRVQSAVTHGFIKSDSWYEWKLRRRLRGRTQRVWLWERICSIIPKASSGNSPKAVCAKAECAAQAELQLLSN